MKCITVAWRMHAVKIGRNKFQYFPERGTYNIGFDNVLTSSERGTYNTRLYNLRYEDNCWIKFSQNQPTFGIIVVQKLLVSTSLKNWGLPLGLVVLFTRSVGFSFSKQKELFLDIKINKIAFKGLYNLFLGPRTLN